MILTCLRTLVLFYHVRAAMPCDPGQNASILHHGIAAVSPKSYSCRVSESFANSPFGSYKVQPARERGRSFYPPTAQPKPSLFTSSDNNSPAHELVIRRTQTNEAQDAKLAGHR
jgi:hypothetical protein